ncbi:MAG: hypothetical protein ACRBN8_22475 [Nannocystales bacterium]
MTAKKTAARDSRPLQTRAQVTNWANELREERISKSGRALIDAAEHVLHRAREANDTSEAAKLYANVDKFVRAAMQADKAKNDNTLQDLDRRREEGDALAESFHAPIQ